MRDTGRPGGERWQHAPKPNAGRPPLQIGDWGRLGNGDQRTAARMMADVAGCMPPKFILSTGDNFYKRAGAGWRAFAGSYGLSPHLACLRCVVARAAACQHASHARTQRRPEPTQRLTIMNTPFSDGLRSASDEQFQESFVNVYNAPSIKVGPPHTQALTRSPLAFVRAAALRRWPAAAFTLSRQAQLLQRSMQCLRLPCVQTPPRRTSPGTQSLETMVRGAAKPPGAPACRPMPAACGGAASASAGVCAHGAT